MLKIPPGAGVATRRGSDPLGWFCEHAFTPQTDRFHHFIIRQFVPEKDDYEYIESVNYGLIPKGMHHGLLFHDYTGKDVEIYQMDCPSELAALAPLELLAYGKTGYDFGFYGQLLIQVPGILAKMLRERRLRRLRPEDFHYHPNGAMNCVEAFWTAHNSVGVNLVPPDVPPMPAAYRQALLYGRMRLIFKGILSRESLGASLARVYGAEGGAASAVGAEGAHSGAVDAEFQGAGE